MVLAAGAAEVEVEEAEAEEAEAVEEDEEEDEDDEDADEDEVAAAEVEVVDDDEEEVEEEEEEAEVDEEVEEEEEEVEAAVEEEEAAVDAAVGVCKIVSFFSFSFSFFASFPSPFVVVALDSFSFFSSPVFLFGADLLPAVLFVFSSTITVVVIAPGCGPCGWTFPPFLMLFSLSALFLFARATNLSSLSLANCAETAASCATRARRSDNCRAESAARFAAAFVSRFGGRSIGGRGRAGEERGDSFGFTFVGG